MEEKVSLKEHYDALLLERKERYDKEFYYLRELNIEKDRNVTSMKEASDKAIEMAAMTLRVQIVTLEKTVADLKSDADKREGFWKVMVGIIAALALVVGAAVTAYLK